MTVKELKLKHLQFKLNKIEAQMQWALEEYVRTKERNSCGRRSDPGNC